jgi:soluble lytic murein transglycosylase
MKKSEEKSFFIGNSWKKSVYCGYDITNFLYRKDIFVRELQKRIAHPKRLMRENKTLKKSPSFLSFAFILLTFFCIPFNVSCAAAEPPQSEEQALQSLRQMTKDGKLPPESVVQQIESRFANTRTGALAKLLRAHIRLSQMDAVGAAEILNSNVFRQRTTVADYALWLRGKALQQARRHAEAMSVFEQLVKDFPNSLRSREAKILWAQSALQSGQAQNISSFLRDLVDKNDSDALLAVAKSFEQQGDQANAVAFYRKVYFYGAGTAASLESEKKLTSLAQSLLPQTAEEIQTRADKLFDAKEYAEAQTAYSNLILSYPNAVTAQTHLKRLITFGNLKNSAQAQSAFDLIPLSAKEKEESYYHLARAFAGNRQWAQARQTIDAMRQRFPSSNWTPKTIVAVGMIAREQKNKLDESYFLKSAVAGYPNAVDVAQAQFELAWLEHDSKNFAASSQMLTEHLARYADKDTTYRGRAGYWAARDSERAGKTAEACVLYNATLYRYSANWYGYLAQQRIANMRALNKCQTLQNFTKDSLVGKAIANLKMVTVAKETSTAREQERFVKAEQLSTIGLFDWAIDELDEAARTAPNSPKVNFAVAKLYRLKEDNTAALLALAKSYPDYSQMFPEEMSREEWEIFYPLEYWQEIKRWAAARNLDAYQVAGLIRQESVFTPRIKSRADAYGLMQLIIPTARAVARKYGISAAITAETLFQPALNIELGTAEMRNQFDKFGRIEYVAVAYNAGPGRVPQWRATLPFEMDEFVEAIPFKETRGYVQGVIRNSAQYRRLYDENGDFKSNVGTRPLRGEIDTKSPEQFAQEFPEIELKNGNKSTE